MMALSNLCSDHILTVYEVFEKEGRLRIIEELMEDDFSGVVRDWHKEYTEDFCRYTLYCVARGIQLMHSKSVLHRDIKSDNILFNPSGEIKLGDFGAAVYLGDDDRSYCEARAGHYQLALSRGRPRPTLLQRGGHMGVWLFRIRAGYG